MLNKNYFDFIFVGGPKGVSPSPEQFGPLFEVALAQSRLMLAESVRKHLG